VGNQYLFIFVVGGCGVVMDHVAELGFSNVN
jgi:hypothetical protein